MKKLIALFFGIIVMFNVSTAQKIIIHTESGETMFNLSDIDSITFNFSDTSAFDCYIVENGNNEREYPIAELEYPPTDSLIYVYVYGDHDSGMGSGPGALIPATKGQFIDQAQASAWYKIIDTNIGSPTVEFRYFAFDVVSNEITNWFSVNYQQQSVLIGVLKEYIWSEPMNIDYQFGQNEILGFITIFHTYGASGIYYEYEYYYYSIQTPTYIDVWYSGTGSAERYYVNDKCPCN